MEDSRETIRNKSKKLVIGSGDAVALYPSCTARRSAQIVNQRIQESSIRFENVNLKAATRYIAINCTPGEVSQAGLHKFLPRRKSNRGRKPTTATPEVTKRKTKEEQESGDTESSWIDKDLEGISDRDMRKIVGKVVEIGISTVMMNHSYKSEGEWRLQR